MKTLIHDRQKLLSEEGVRQSESKLAAALSRFGRHVRSAELQLSDINGPRGGLDKECRLVVRLRRGGDVVATVLDDSVSAAIGRAIKRMERAVARRIEKQSMHERNRYSGPSFVFYN